MRGKSKQSLGVDSGLPAAEMLPEIAAILFDLFNFQTFLQDLGKTETKLKSGIYGKKKKNYWPLTF